MTPSTIEYHTDPGEAPTAAYSIGAPVYNIPYNNDVTHQSNNGDFYNKTQYENDLSQSNKFNKIGTVQHSSEAQSYVQSSEALSYVQSSYAPGMSDAEYGSAPSHGETITVVLTT